MRRLAAALIHHPVLDRQGEEVTTAITNLDLHDVSRSAHTYGLERVYIAHPIAAQRELATRVREHWVTGSGKRRIPDRSPAMNLLAVVDSLETAIHDHGGGASVELWSTSATAHASALSHARAAELLRAAGDPVLILFGTGWGLAPRVLERAKHRLEPILSARADGYNHLSVRAAAAILFDRLLSPQRANHLPGR